jgi:hypothetical protein
LSSRAALAAPGLRHLGVDVAKQRRD